MLCRTCGGCIFKRGWMWPLRSQSPAIKMSSLWWDAVLLLSHLHMISIDSFKSCWTTPLCSPFSVATCVRFEMLKRSLLPHCGFNDALDQRSISLMSEAVSGRLFCGASYSQSNSLHTSVIALQKEHPQRTQLCEWIRWFCVYVCSALFVGFWYKSVSS